MQLGDRKWRYNRYARPPRSRNFPHVHHGDFGPCSPHAATVEGGTHLAHLQARPLTSPDAPPKEEEAAAPVQRPVVVVV